MTEVNQQFRNQPVASVTDAEIRHVTRSVELERQSNSALEVLNDPALVGDTFYYRTEQSAEEPLSLDKFEIVQRLLRNPAHFISTEIVRLQASYDSAVLARIDNYGYFSKLLTEIGASYDKPLDKSAYIYLVTKAVDLSSSEAFLFRGQAGSSVITPDERGFLNIREGEAIKRAIDHSYETELPASPEAGIGATAVAESANLVRV